MLQLPEGVRGRSRPEHALYRRHTLSALAASRSFSRAASRAAAGSGLASTLAIVLRNTRTRTPEAMSTSISSGLTTFDTVPQRADHRPVFLLLCLLRPDQQEVEHDENQNERQELDQRALIQQARSLS